MTKAKAIRQLINWGWVVVDIRKGKSSSEFTSPDGRHVIANAQDLLCELIERAAQ